MSPTFESAVLTIFQGNCLDVLRSMPDCSVQCCVTSPPYWGLRDYGIPPSDWPEVVFVPMAGLPPMTVAAQSCVHGLEKDPWAYVAHEAAIFREVRRVLQDDGTLWLNLGDSYCSQGGNHDGRTDNQPNVGASRVWRNGSGRADGIVDERGQRNRNGNSCSSLKPKDLCGIPWRVAFALQADGWYLRSDNIWHKPNPMPESVLDRPTRAHEYFFLFAKSEQYYYDAEAIKEPPSPALIKQIEDGYNGEATKDFCAALAQDASATKSRIINGYRAKIDKQRGHSRRHDGFNGRWDKLSRDEQMMCGSNKRDVWSVAPANYDDAHFATFPPDLIKPCILAGSKPSDRILDVFGGSGTTGEVANELGRKAVLIELNPKYIEIQLVRTNVTPGLALT